MTEMHTYRVTPKAPLVFRSGKPFLAGTRESANYPWPSAWAGLLRTRYMDQHGLKPEQAAQLLELPAHGAMLAKQAADGSMQMYLPKPSDALLLATSTAFERLEPLAPIAGTGSDLPSGLLPIGLASGAKGKPQSSAKYWSLDHYLDWAAGHTVTAGLDNDMPVEERRTHVAIAAETSAAKDGQLFQTTALDFALRRESDEGFGSSSNASRTAPWVFLGRGPRGLSPGLVVFGGERRLSFLDRGPDDAFSLPKTLAASLASAEGFVLTLATPAIFAAGWRPGWLDNDLVGVMPDSNLRVRLRAVMADRWQPISGWDLKARAPKPMRRAVAAGASFWFERLEGEFDPGSHWLMPVSDSLQDRHDGFGLAVLRPWQPIS